MQSGLCSLAYLSRSLILARGAAHDREIAAIFAASERNNRPQGLTGALLAGRSMFAQVLEGESDRVAAAFARIQPDPRHCDVVVLHFKPIRLRVFADWSMRQIETPLPVSAQAVFENLACDQADIDNGLSGQILVELFDDLTWGRPIGLPPGRGHDD